MCLSTAYSNSINENNILCKNVTRVDIDGKIITITDLLGSEVTVTGTLVSVDMMENTVVINTED
jgi:predicted RNA-binding protein